MNVRPIFLLLSALLGFGAIGSPQETPAGKAAISVVIAATHTVAKAGSHLLLRVTCINISDHDLTEAATPIGNETKRKLSIKLYDSDGKPVQETAYSMMIHGRLHPGLPPGIGPASSGAVVWKEHPGEFFDENADLSKEFELKPGKYTVHAEGFDPDNKTWVKSNTITLTIVE